MRGWGGDSPWGSPGDEQTMPVKVPPRQALELSPPRTLCVSSARAPGRAVCGQATGRYGARSLGPEHRHSALPHTCGSGLPEDLGLTVSALPLISPPRARGPSRVCQDTTHGNRQPPDSPKCQPVMGDHCVITERGPGGPSANAELTQSLSALAAALESPWGTWRSPDAQAPATPALPAHLLLASS